MELLFALENDRALRREHQFRDPLDLLNIGDEHLLRYYRFPRQDILNLCENLEPYIGRVTRRSHAIPTHTQVLCSLRFYASGSFQSVVGDLTGLHQSSVSQIISSVTDALYRRAVQEIKMPTGVRAVTETMQGFHNIDGFPKVIGAIDGTHIPIEAPSEDENLYINRKNFHSINFQVVCDNRKLIINFNGRYPGATHDAFIWSNSQPRRKFENGEFPDCHLIGDSGYPLEPYLLTPFREPATPAEQRYNRSHAKTRVLIERTIGELKSRFRCLYKSGGTLQYSPEKCSKVAAACMLLHNWCIRRRIPLDEFIEDEDDDPPENQRHYDIHEDQPNPQGDGDESGLNLRRQIVRRYFS